MNGKIWGVLLCAACQKEAVTELEASARRMDERVADLELMSADYETRIALLEDEVATLKQLLDQTATPAQVAWISLVSQGLTGETGEDGTTLEVLYVEGVDLVVEGANLEVRSADPDPAVLDGTGNLIVGWNRDDGTATRTGSNNLVIGDYGSYTSYLGIVAGYGNTVAAPYTVSLGGSQNLVTGYGACTIGGSQNFAAGSNSVVAGGALNEALGTRSTVGGGQGNTAGVSDGGGADAHVSGGYQNTAAGSFAVVVGGNLNAAEAEASVVVGGYHNTLRDGASMGVIDCGSNNTTNDVGECSEAVVVDD